MKTYTPTVSRARAFKFARLCTECGSMAEAAAAARRMARSIRGSARKRGTWKYFLLRFAASIDAAGGEPDLSRAFCYSLRAWRYPAAFLRQAQNTLLLRFNRRAIIDAFKALPIKITLRLYVDGDFDSESTALFWFNLLRQRPDVECYGYSKSWAILEKLATQAPANYRLNLSSGGIDDSPEYRERMRGLPMTRGDFIALEIEGNFPRGFARYAAPEYHRAVRAAAAAAGLGKVFSCPGICGDCTGVGHACGATRDDGSDLVQITIVNGIH
jgi:hypothetical protein